MSEYDTEIGHDGEDARRQSRPASTAMRPMPYPAERAERAERAGRAEPPWNALEDRARETLRRYPWIGVGAAIGLGAAVGMGSRRIPSAISALGSLRPVTAAKDAVRAAAGATHSREESAPTTQDDVHRGSEASTSAGQGLGSMLRSAVQRTLLSYVLGAAVSSVTNKQ